MTRRLPWLAAAAILLSSAAGQAQNLEDGKDVYGPCAACHGANGEGGKGGEYPRIAGQPASFIVDTLKAFQERKRYNLPMFPYTEPRELSEQDMKDVAAYVTGIVLPTKVPEFTEADSALDRLLAMEKVLVVPRLEGDLENGRKLYRRRCASCHGRSGQGRKGFPLLVGQYPTYLMKQVGTFRRAERTHEADEAGEGVLKKISEKDIADILAWLTSIQGEEPEPDPVGKTRDDK